jgi:hypothetical protein
LIGSKRCNLVKFETAVTIVIMVCIFMSFYFAFLSLQAADTATKLPFVALAASCLITGTVMFLCWMAHAGINKVLRKQ